MLVQPTLAVCLIHHAHQLFLGDAVLLRLAKQQAQQLLPQAEEQVNGSQHNREQPQQRRGRHCPALRRLLGKAFGRDLAKDQNDHRQHHGGRRRAVLVKPLGKQHRGNGGGGNIHDVVADEDGGEQLVILLCQRKGAGRPGVALVRPVLQPDAVEGCKCRFGGGEVGRQGHKNHKGYGHRGTGTVHLGRINSAFFIEFEWFSFSLAVYHIHF